MKLLKPKTVPSYSKSVLLIKSHIIITVPSLQTTSRKLKKP